MFKEMIMKTKYFFVLLVPLCLMYSCGELEEMHLTGTDGELCASDATWSHGEGDLQNTKRAPGIRTKGCFYGPVDTPKVIWSFELGGPGTTAAPVIGDDGTIYIVGEYPGEPLGGGVRNAGIIAITPQGSLKWFFPVPVDIGSALYRIYSESVTISSDQTIYFGGWDSTLYALNPDGTIKWKKKGFHHRFDIGYPPVVPPIIDNENRIYSGTDSIFCFRSDGSVIWRFFDDTLGYCVRMALGTSHIFCALQDRGILALSYDGKRQWFTSVDLSNLPHYSMIVDEDDNLYFKVNSNVVQSLNSKGQVRWTAGGGGVTEPVLRGDYLYFGVLFASVLRVDKDTGKEDAVLGVTDAFLDDYTSPLIDDQGNVYIGTRAAYLSCFTQKADTLWSIPLDPNFTSGSCGGPIALSQDGTLFIATYVDGPSSEIYKLFAIH